MFWVGFIVGAVIGGNLGVVLMACMKINKN